MAKPSRHKEDTPEPAFDAKFGLILSTIKARRAKEHQETDVPMEDAVTPEKTDTAKEDLPLVEEVKEKRIEDLSDEALEEKLDALLAERTELYALFRKSVAEGAESVGIITLDDIDTEEDVDV